MKFISRILAMMILVALSGCLQGPEVAGPVHPKPLSPDQMDGERLAREGEALVTPVSFMYADELFTWALEKDPSNLRAKFYKFAIAPAMREKGLLNRVKPFVLNSTEAVKRNYANVNDHSVQSPTVKEWLLNGPQNIATEADIQAFLDGMNSDFRDLRVFLKAIRNETLDLNVVSYSDIAAASCRVVRATPKAIPELVGCGNVSVTTYKASRPDLEQIRASAAGIQLYTILWTSYDATGIHDLAKKIESDGRPMSQKNIYEYLRGHSGFGGLRASHRLQDVMEMGSDLVEATRWIKENADTLCPGGRPADRNGHVVRYGICVPEYTRDNRRSDRLIDAAEYAFLGQSVDLVVEVGYEKFRETTVNLTPAFSRPQSNVLAYYPNNFNTNGDSKGFLDTTLGGIFPRGDVNENFKPNPVSEPPKPLPICTENCPR